MWSRNPDDDLRELEREILIDPLNFELRARLVNLYRRLGNTQEASIAPLIDPLIQRIVNYPEFAVIMAIVNLYTGGGQVYLVGGKVYRNLLELFHFRNFSAETKDWDFLFLGIPSRRPGTVLPEGWEEVRFYHGNFTIRLRHKASGRVVDIISIFDSAELIGTSESEVENLISTQQYREALEIYFEAVPLNIQALALDLQRAFMVRWGYKASLISILKLSVLRV